MQNHILADGGIIQMCFVTDDVDRTASWLGDFLNVPAGPVRILRPDPNALYKGEKRAFSCRIRFIELGSMSIEILEPGPEDSAWRDVLEANGPGFHHMAIKTRNLTKQRAYLEQRGHELIQIGGFDGVGDAMPISTQCLNSARWLSSSSLTMTWSRRPLWPPTAREIALYGATPRGAPRAPPEAPHSRFAVRNSMSMTAPRSNIPFAMS